VAQGVGPEFKPQYRKKKKKASKQAYVRLWAHSIQITKTGAPWAQGHLAALFLRLYYKQVWLLAPKEVASETDQRGATAEL
jgi:hypothetical protein